MKGKTYRFIVVAILALALLIPSFGSAVAAPPPDGPPGLQRAKEVKDLHANELLEITGVVGVGVGHNGDSNAAIIIFTETRGVGGLPTSLDGVPVIVRFSGVFLANPKPDGKGKLPKDEEPELTPRDRWVRPVPIGVSTGHPAITAGTIGARVTDVVNKNVYALSNNHVYADQNRATIGDAVIQPGTYDDGISPADDIGTLWAYVRIDFSGGVNYVDAAIALTNNGLLDNATPPNGYGTPKSTIAEATIGLKVKKYGRTTGETNGRVYAMYATVEVNYGTGVALFEDQIIVTPRSFSAGGDSGSLIVVNNKRSGDHLKPVGLLFAGSSLYAVANPIGLVLDEFGVTIDGE